MNFKKSFQHWQQNEFWLAADTSRQTQILEAFDKSSSLDAKRAYRKHNAQNFVCRVLITFASKVDISYDQAVLAFHKGKILPLRKVIHRLYDPIELKLKHLEALEMNPPIDLVERAGHYQTILFGDDVSFASKIRTHWDFALGCNLHVSRKPDDFMNRNIREHHYHPDLPKDLLEKLMRADGLYIPEVKPTSRRFPRNEIVAASEMSVAD